MPSPAEEVKNRLDVVEVVGSYLKLQQVGSNLKGLCPFHHEKTPSFYVSKEKQIWHCFGCGTGGDIFSFVMKMDGVEFPDALRMLADRAGVVVREEDPRVRSERSRMYDTLKTATAFYREQLATEPQRDVREYLLRRGLAVQTLENFKLGYAPSATWDALVRHLKFKGFTASEMERSGLVLRNERGDLRDRFHNRVMFPLFDIQANVVGFSGRLFDARHTSAEHTPPKYVNTPETLLYNKGKLLYGLHAAKDAIRTKGCAVLVEGQMDLVLSHQAGVEQAVATSGTALTPDHVRLLKRHTTQVFTAFDSDEAGQTATRRSVMLLLANDMDVRVIPIEGGKDPADMVCQDATSWQRAASEGAPLIDYYMQTALRGRDISSAQEKRRAADDILPFIRILANPVLRGHYIGKLSSALGIEERFLHEALEKLPGATESSRETPYKPLAAATTLLRSRWTDIEEFLLAFILKYPALARFHAHTLSVEFFTLPHTRALFGAVTAALSAPREREQIDALSPAVPEEFRGDFDRMHLKTERYVESLEQLNPEKEIAAFAKELRVRALKQRMQTLGQAMKQAVDTADRTPLLEEFAKVSRDLQDCEKQGMVLAQDAVVIS